MKFNRLFQKSTDWILLISSIAALSYLLYYHYSLVVFKWPIQYREASILMSTRALLDGLNPYNMELQPYFSNAYGLAYNLVVLPFAYLFGPTLLLHKIISGVCTLIILAASFVTIKKYGGRATYTIPLIAVLYSSLLYSKTSLAEPDSLGTLLLLLSIIIPILRNYSPQSLGMCIALSCIGFFTKPYFVFGIAVISLILLFRRQWKPFLVFSTAAAVFLSIELFILISLFDSYYINTFLANMNYGAEAAKASWTTEQLLFVLKTDKFFYGAFAAILIFYFTSADRDKHHTAIIDLLLAGGFLLLVFVAYLGKNTGAFATYLYQMPLPVMVVAAGTMLAKIEQCRVINLIKVSLSLAMLSVMSHYPPFMAEFKAAENDWIKAEQLVSTHRNILNSPAIAPLMLAKNLPVYDSGQTGMFLYGLRKPEQVPKKQREKALTAKQRFGEEINNGVVHKKFDLIMLDREFSIWLIPPTPLMNSYNYAGHLTLQMPHLDETREIDIWKPKP